MLLPEIWQTAGRAAAELAVSQLWQGVVVAAGLAVCLWLAPRTRASHRFALWMAAFVLVAALPAAPWVMGLFKAGGQATVLDAATPAAPWFRLDERWGVAVLVAWALLAGLRLAMLVAGAVRARRIWKSAVPMEGVSAGLGVGRLRGRAGVEICQSSELDRPSVIGFFRPRVLVPDWLATKLSAGELQQIVLHEVEHLRRMDDWTNLGQKLVAAVLPLNLALGWMERQLEREREMATDEAVVRRTRAPRAYAACLASVAERRLEMRMGQREAFELAAWRRRPELAERILSLLRTPETIGPVGRTTLAGALAAGMAAATVLLAHAPQLVAFAPEVRPFAVQERSAQAVAKEQPRLTLSLKPKAAAVRRAVTVHPAEPMEAQASSSAEGVVPVVARMQSVAQEPDQGGWVVLAVFEERVAMQRPGTVEADFDRDEGQKSALAVRHGAQRATQQELIWKLLQAGRGGWMLMEL